MVEAQEEINLTIEQEVIVTAFQKQYPEASRFTAVKFCFGRKFELSRVFPLYEGYKKVVKERGLENLTAAQVLHELRTGKMYIPGSRDKMGAALFVIQASKHVIGQFPQESTIKLAYYLGECVTASLKTQRNGLTLILDLDGTEWANFDGNFMAEIIGFFQNHIPAAVKNILIWRAPWWIRTAIQVVSPFLKIKMRKRIKLCDNLHGLLEFVNKSDLPVEFGGSFEYDHEYFIRKELSKGTTEDVLTSLTSSSAGDQTAQFAGTVKYLEMDGAECAVSPTLEADLQKERESSLNDLNDQIEFIVNHPGLVEGDSVNNYPVPIHSLMQNKIYRLTLDVTAEFRSFPISKEAKDPMQSAWRQAQQLPTDQERIDMMKEALYLDRTNFLIKSSK